MPWQWPFTGGVQKLDVLCDITDHTQPFFGRVSNENVELGRFILDANCQPAVQRRSECLMRQRLETTTAPTVVVAKTREALGEIILRGSARVLRRISFFRLIDKMIDMMICSIKTCTWPPWMSWTESFYVYTIWLDWSTGSLLFCWIMCCCMYDKM